jgi:hypothetical protein
MQDRLQLGYQQLSLLSRWLRFVFWRHLPCVEHVQQLPGKFRVVLQRFDAETSQIDLSFNVSVIAVTLHAELLYHGSNGIGRRCVFSDCLQSSGRQRKHHHNHADNLNDNPPSEENTGSSHLSHITSNLLVYLRFSH